MSLVRRKVFRLILIPVCLLVVAIVLFGVATRRPEPRFISKLGGKLLGENRSSYIVFQNYQVNGDVDEMIGQMRRELVPTGWTEYTADLRPGRISLVFEKGEEGVFLQPGSKSTPVDFHRVILFRETTWLERQWHEALIKVGLRSRNVP